MVNSTMVQLFKQYSLGSEVTKVRNFNRFMNSISMWYQSVWGLKRFTRLSYPEPMRAVVVDYGFMNCQTPKERIDLRRLYADFFSKGRDEMNLHQACIDGRLFQFLESVLGPLPVSPEVLSNQYPLEKCNHMGMVVKNALVCPESMYQVVEDMRRERGESGVVLTIPDECDPDMELFSRDRAAFLDGEMSIATTNFRGRTVKSIHVDRRHCYSCEGFVLLMGCVLCYRKHSDSRRDSQRAIKVAGFIDAEGCYLKFCRTLR